MSQVLASPLLANGLLNTFADNYIKIRNRQADSRLAAVMDLAVPAINRRHEFGYFEAAPHVELWKRGDTIPTDAMSSVQFTAFVHDWGRRVPWHADDRKDEQTGTLMQAAAAAGQSAALLPERFFFDLLAGTTNTLPAVPNAPDGVAFFSTTDAASAARFGVTSGNLITGGGITSTSLILTDYYKAIAQFLQFQDGKGQPLLSADIIDAGVIVICAAADVEIMERAFLQKRQNVVYGSNTAAAAQSNIVQDASRNVELWPSARLSTGDWYVFLKASPIKPAFELAREGVLEDMAIQGMNNSDQVRSTQVEYVQWGLRSGAAINLPIGAIKINN